MDESLGAMEEVAAGGDWAMKLDICIATMRKIILPVYPTFSLDSMASFEHQFHVQYNTPEENLGIVGSYGKLYRKSDADVLMFVHDDVAIHEENWDVRVLTEFEDPTVGVVGFGGATAHGVPDLYKTPYRLNDLARFGYMSNVDDAEVHGERFTGACDVAVLDGFALCVRRSLLDRANAWGFMAGHCDFFCYDYALCALALRHGFRVRALGIRCHHYGGRTSVGKDVQAITGLQAYEESHRWFYEEFRDVMPFWVKEKK